MPSTRELVLGVTEPGPELPAGSVDEPSSGCTVPVIETPRLNGVEIRRYGFCLAGVNEPAAFVEHR